MASNNKAPGLLMKNAGIFNPVLVQAVGLCPVVAMATSVKSAALLAGISAVIITLSEFFASLFLKAVPRWIRIGIYIILGGAIVVPFMIFIERTNASLFGSFGIYLPIMAVNSLNVLRCERFAVKISPLAALADGVTASLGYSAVLIFVGFFREILGSGSLFGVQIFRGFSMPGLLLPFGGFLMLGFAGALLRTLISKFWPKYLDKKQPKPISSKSRKKPGKKQNAQTFTEVPEFDADESLFSLEDISQYEETEEYDDSARAEYNPSVIPEQPTAKVAHESTEKVIPPISSVKEKAETRATERPKATVMPKPTVTHKPQPPVIKKPQPPAIKQTTAKKPDIGLKELSLDDISADTSKTSSSGTNAEDELELLMNRSIGDILSAQKKEDDK
ncbi:MAG: hypothetical protein J6B25_08970 [Clostridia bacterium]|nr:hypothetical protein [Clostridia bacterium]